MNDSSNTTGPNASGSAASSPADSQLGETLEHGVTSSHEALRPPSLTNVQQWVGRRLGRYELRSLLGSGGMGMVFLAYDTVIERDVALKMLPQEVSSNETALARFLSEARAAGKLTHPNAIAVYEVNQENGVYYLVMEYAGGGTIASELETRGALPVVSATQITADACRGLAAAHHVGLVHRDIKPANLLRSRDGTVKIADFGLAKHTVGTALHLTREGSVAGTPYYMSPEQCESRPVDARSDLYSLGATYYSLLTGEHPYEDAGSIVQVMFAHINGEPLDPRKTNPSLPLACTEIIQRATAKRVEERYQTAEEMLCDLNAVLATLTGTAPIALPSRSGYEHARSRARTSRRTWLTAAGLGALGLASGWGGLQLLRNEPPTTPAPGDATPMPSFSGPPLRVGVLHSLTGNMEESESPVVDATLLAIEEINRQGGVLGRRIEPIVRDGRSDPLEFARQATALIDKEKVCTIFGCWTSAARRTIVPIFERHNHLLIYPVQYEGIERSPNVVYLGAVPNQQILPALDWLFGFRRKRRFFMVGTDYVFPRTANAVMRDELAQLGAEVVGEEYLPLGNYDVQPIVDQILATQPDAILNSINGDSNVPFFNRLRAAGLTSHHVSTVSFSIGEHELRRLDPAKMVGDYVATNYFQSLPSPTNRVFIEKFRAKYGPLRLLTDPMEAAYVGVHLWSHAVEKADSTSPPDIHEAFGGLTFDGPGGLWTIDPDTHHAYKTPRVGQIKADGHFEVVWNDVGPVKPQPYPASRTPEQWEQFLANLYRGWGNHWSAPSR
jgi:urea transport system substrate-binding protein